MSDLRTRRVLGMLRSVRVTVPAAVWGALAVVGLCDCVGSVCGGRAGCMDASGWRRRLDGHRLERRHRMR